MFDSDNKSLLNGDFLWPLISIDLMFDDNTSTHGKTAAFVSSYTYQIHFSNIIC